VVNLGANTLTITNANGTFGGVIQDGFAGPGGSLAITGGKEILTGTNTYTGATTITGATLEVDGAIANTSSVTVNAGGTLSGTGLVDPTTTTIMSGGTLAPGSTSNPTGTLTIAGNLAFQSGALYAVQVTTPSAASSVVVSGTASLAGTVQETFTLGRFVSKQMQYTILTAAGGLGGTTFGALTNVNLPSGASDSLSYDASHVYLNLTVPFTSYTGLNQNQQNVANALTNYFNTVGGIPSQFFGLTPGGLTQLDGEVATGAERGAFQMMNEFLNLLLDPFVNGRGGGFGAGGRAIGFAPEQQDSLPPDIALAYASIVAKAPPQNFEQRWTAWGGAFGGSNSANGDPAVGSTNVSTQTYGFAAGMDYHLTPDTIIGFGLGGGGLNWGLAGGLGTGRADSFMAGAYGITYWGPAYIGGALALANHWFSTNRAALGDQLTASFDGQSFGARLESGYRFGVLPTFGVTPYAALQAQEFFTPAYSETDVTGGGLGLNYAPGNATDVRTELGAHFDAPIAVARMPLVLYARAAWAHDFVSNPTLSAAFQSLPGSNFTVSGAAIPGDSALASAGAELFLTPRWTLQVKFDGEFANGSQTYAGSGTLRYTW
jgi:autotransporter-associated beta strand protein